MENDDSDNEFSALIEIVEETFEAKDFSTNLNFSAFEDKTSDKTDLESNGLENSELENEFAEFNEQSEPLNTAAQPAPANNFVSFDTGDTDEEFAEFDGIEAAHEISNILMEDQPPVKEETAAIFQDNPLNDAVAKTQLAAEKLRTHLASLSTTPKQQNENLLLNQAAKPLPAAEAVVPEATVQEAIVPETPESIITEEIAPEAIGPETMAAEVSEEPSEEPLTPIEAATESFMLRETEETSDELLAAFVESPISSDQKQRKISLHSLATKFPKVYLACSFVLALVGFAYILAIPALLGYTLFNGFEMLNSPFTNNMVMLLLALFSVSLFLFMVGYKLFDLKFVGPGGITLGHDNAAELMEKIKQLKSSQSIPKIHEIVLTRRHELNLIKIPRFGLPVWSKNVLAIGYPLLQTLPAEYFDVAISRRLTQFNKRKNTLHNWLSFMRRTWTLYAVSLKERKGVIDLLHYCFFAPYASLYRHFAVYVSQNDEILADEIALRSCNDRDLMKTAQTLRITRAMLIQYFWPKLNEELQDNMASPNHIRPYRQLPDALNTLLKTKNVDSWFIRLGQETSNPGDPEPPFALRMEVMGHRKVSLPSAFDTNAAQHYFGEQYDEMTDLLDTLWAEEVQKELFIESLENDGHETSLPCRLAIEPA